MYLVETGVHVVLQEHFYTIIHPLANVLAAAARNDSNNPECN